MTMSSKPAPNVSSPMLAAGGRPIALTRPAGSPWAGLRDSVQEQVEVVGRQRGQDRVGDVRGRKQRRVAPGHRVRDGVGGGGVHRLQAGDDAVDRHGRSTPDRMRRTDSRWPPTPRRPRPPPGLTSDRLPQHWPSPPLRQCVRDPLRPSPSSAARRARTLRHRRILLNNQPQALNANLSAALVPGHFIPSSRTPARSSGSVIAE
ncbi:hypothetical protein LAUMK13_00134 [Mycobacterium innocens]|uniref:Uncharacterized protein n=1 Tax=Mycobacterium innocens TaxID=2341083 RepID=A0A498PP26_9MYCO|nr:hypothetical protein LAUMK13_00134 [Mycobacterium innocens]